MNNIHATITKDGVGSRRLMVRHATHYSYDVPVQRSSHRLHLRPILDVRQRVLSHTLTITPPALTLESEDVFGNAMVTFDVTEPYTQMSIEAQSEVEIVDVDPFACARTPIRPSFPLVWMPWEQKMLQPYLTSQELPDTQLHEIFDYAISITRCRLWRRTTAI